MKEKLKSCPFCPKGKGQPKLKPAGFYIQVECLTCGARTRGFNTDTSDFTHDAPKEAIKAWNWRLK